MPIGSVYLWEPSDSEFTGGRVRLAEVELPFLSDHRMGSRGLSGRYVDIVGSTGAPESFAFDPCGGGMHGGEEGAASASRFGEVNVYYHVSLMARHIDGVLRSLGARPLPKIKATVGARAAARRKSGNGAVPAAKAAPIWGVKYRYPSPAEASDFCIPGYGELAFGPANRFVRDGWLARISGGAYLHDPSHDAGAIYQAFGLHVLRHLADIQAERLRTPRKAYSIPGPLEDAISAYLAASMMRTPHPGCWSVRHDPDWLPAGTLLNRVRLDDPASGLSAQLVTQAVSGALWDLHVELGPENDGCLGLTVAALLALGRLADEPYAPSRNATHAIRTAPDTLASCLLFADETHFGGQHGQTILETFERRGITADPWAAERLRGPSVPPLQTVGSEEMQAHVKKIREKFPEVIIPADTDLLTPDALETRLSADGTVYHLAAVGDVMTGMRMRHRIRRFGADYAFAWVDPIFRRCSLITGNLEGPFSSAAEKAESTRNFSYKVDPKSAAVLRRGRFAAMTIANNHLMDCGREGVIETLDTLRRHFIGAYGGGRNQEVAHDPAIFDGTDLRIGLLGYYWNSRTAARGELPGSARDLPELVERDMARLRPLVDRIAVMVHWGIPYERRPTDEDRLKAQHFIDLGADAVIGHHPHILQPIEVYRDRPILYSVGNFAFGSGNSKGESLLPCFRFGQDRIDLDIYPVYVQNRDPRLNYQPKVIGGDAGRETIERLLASSAGIEGVISGVRDECLSLSIGARP